MSDQSHHWSRAAASYEQDFIDPYLPDVRNPLREAVAACAAADGVVADLGCGVGVLLPFLAQHFGRVIAVDFAAGMLARAQKECAGLSNVEFVRRSLTDLTDLAGTLSVAVAVNSLILPDVVDLESALSSIRSALK